VILESESYSKLQTQRQSTRQRARQRARELMREKGLELIDARLSFVTYEELARETPDSDSLHWLRPPPLVKANCIPYLEASRRSMHTSSYGFTFSEGKLTGALALTDP
jgi:hypothetical protein